MLIVRQMELRGQASRSLVVTHTGQRTLFTALAGPKTQRLKPQMPLVLMRQMRIQIHLITILRVLGPRTFYGWRSMLMMGMIKQQLVFLIRTTQTILR